MTVISTKTFVSTKADLLDERVNDFLKDIKMENIVAITPIMGASETSYSKKGDYLIKPAYYIGTQVLYWKEVEVEHQMDIFEEVEDGSEF